VVDQFGMPADLRAIVECLLAAHYSECEIVDYLAGPFGLPLEQAIREVQRVSGPEAPRRQSGPGSDSELSSSS
jgi:hypothetical protein